MSLDRIARLLDRLGRPQDVLPPAVHVAGTNGKGSVIAFMRAILEAQGLRVHVYTSPHLVRFHERIVVAGQEITDLELIDVLQTCEHANNGAPITFFEITTAAAFVAFANNGADIALIETGLGGRLDATNLIERPALTVLTRIGLDHQAFLGETVDEIAGEKAGILKAGVTCLSAAQEPAAAAVIRRRSLEVDAPLMTEGAQWRVAALDDGGFRYQDDRGELTFPRPALTGAHQIGNAGLAIAAVRALEGAPTELYLFAQGLRNARWPGRLQRLENGALADLLPSGAELWLDGGHNPQAADAIAAHLATWRDRPLTLVIGMLTTKDAERYLEILSKVAASAVCVPVPGTNESVEPDILADKARQIGYQARTACDLTDALRSLPQSPASEARILICGSLYLVGAALEANSKSQATPK